VHALSRALHGLMQDTADFRHSSKSMDVSKIGIDGTNGNGDSKHRTTSATNTVATAAAAYKIRMIPDGVDVLFEIRNSSDWTMLIGSTFKNRDDDPKEKTLTSQECCGSTNSAAVAALLEALRSNNSHMNPTHAASTPHIVLYEDLLAILRNQLEPPSSATASVDGAAAMDTCIPQLSDHGRKALAFHPLFTIGSGGSRSIIIRYPVSSSSGSSSSSSSNSIDRRNAVSMPQQLLAADTTGNTTPLIGLQWLLMDPTATAAAGAATAVAAIHSDMAFGGAGKKKDCSGISGKGLFAGKVRSGSVVFRPPPSSSSSSSSFAAATLRSQVQLSAMSSTSSTSSSSTSVGSSLLSADHPRIQSYVRQVPPVHMSVSVFQRQHQHQHQCLAAALMGANVEVRPSGKKGVATYYIKAATFYDILIKISHASYVHADDDDKDRRGSAKNGTTGSGMKVELACVVADNQVPIAKRSEQHCAATFNSIQTTSSSTSTSHISANAAFAKNTPPSTSNAVFSGKLYAQYQLPMGGEGDEGQGVPAPPAPAPPAEEEKEGEEEGKVSAAIEHRVRVCFPRSGSYTFTPLIRIVGAPVGTTTSNAMSPLQHAPSVINAPIGADGNDAPCDGGNWWTSSTAFAQFLVT